jgi:hypothetical protein
MNSLVLYTFSSILLQSSVGLVLQKINHLITAGGTEHHSCTSFSAGRTWSFSFDFQGQKRHSFHIVQVVLGLTGSWQFPPGPHHIRQWFLRPIHNVLSKHNHWSHNRLLLKAESTMSSSCTLLITVDSLCVIKEERWWWATCWYLNFLQCMVLPLAATYETALVMIQLIASHSLADSSPAKDDSNSSSSCETAPCLCLEWWRSIQRLMAAP